MAESIRARLDALEGSIVASRQHPADAEFENWLRGLSDDDLLALERFTERYMDRPYSGREVMVMCQRQPGLSLAEAMSQYEAEHAP
jgi:hypothetical protein